VGIGFPSAEVRSTAPVSFEQSLQSVASSSIIACFENQRNGLKTTHIVYLVSIMFPTAWRDQRLIENVA
jgi:hypothetical protein